VAEAATLVAAHRVSTEPFYSALNGAWPSGKDASDGLAAYERAGATW
jgi:hypothetical protein